MSKDTSSPSKRYSGLNVKKVLRKKFFLKTRSTRPSQPVIICDGKGIFNYPFLVGLVVKLAELRSRLSYDAIVTEFVSFTSGDCPDSVSNKFCEANSACNDYVACYIPCA